jgi:hypothetical protein
VIILIKERENNKISVSIRTTTPAIDASKIAETFGGGGHSRASGFTMNDKNIKDVEYEIINSVKNLQKERLGIVKEKIEEEKKIKEEKESMINVKELMERAEKAQKATEVMKKVGNIEESKSQTSEDVQKKSKKEKKNKKTYENFKFKSPQIEEESKKPSETSGTIYKFED